MADDSLDLNAYNGAPLVGTCIAFLSLTWLAVGLRTYTRAVVIKSVQEDDWLMLVAQWQALATVTYVINMMFIKLSIGIFLLRLSARKAYNWVICISLVIIGIWSLVIFFYDIFQCSPVQKQWDFRIQGGKCASPDEIIAAAYAISVMTIASDWLYALLPIPMLWSVKMTSQAKATVILILGLGILYVPERTLIPRNGMLIGVMNSASIATLIRIKYLSVLQDTDDLLFSATQVMIWTIIEPGVAIVASSLATIRPLLRAMKIHGFESTGRTLSAPSAHARYTTEDRNMPIVGRVFGPNDVSLKNVEPSYDKTAPDPSTRMTIGLTFDQSHAGRATSPRLDTQQGRGRINDGKEYSPSRSINTEISHATNSSSFDDIHSLEAQSQESEYFGYAPGKRGR
ncbi:integral membrane family [Trichoderma arundinaceum]|uniref:Integral membrane family n=1 Tax=Trichoderma arundinaceum TaxID=490622 RepID=A0A395N784_TRIAR|nr:integral membrane family [Trichoderma arundinaceum]